MKQYITREQLGKLTVKGKESLTKWAVDHKYTSPEIRRFNWYENNLLLSIGQMIEFLSDKGILGGTWDGQMILPCQFDDGSGLCDALWEAVTSILEK